MRLEILPPHLNDILGLQAFRALNRFKFHGLLFLEGPEPIPLDGAMMHKDIGAILPGDKPITLGFVKPFHLTGFFAS